MSQQLIHLLSPQVANQIAAGEVVERPASALKELMENALDAGTTRISVAIQGAGKRAITVEDDGCGMSAADAEMALKRHATSKIESSEDLHRIASHGFRGEALPSIASVSRFRMQTALTGAGEGVEIRVDGGAATEVRPAPARRGTRIEVLDLFLNTPARLNFMRSDRTEEAQILETFRHLALANPAVAMRLEMDGRSRCDFPVQDQRARMLEIMGEAFAENSVEIAITHEAMRISGHFGLPTFHHRDSTRMLFLVNGRVIRDKQLIAAVRAGYRDVMFHDRYPVALIAIEIDPVDVDVNVHPAKREVRFRAPQKVRAGVIAAVRAAIEKGGQQVASTTTDQAMRSMGYEGASHRPSSGSPYSESHASGGASSSSFRAPTSYSGRPSAEVQRMLFSQPQVAESEAAYETTQQLDLGQPLAQIHSCYILAQRQDGVILIDQHAAHERMTYEKLKRQLSGKGVASQKLLTPELFQPDSRLSAWLHDYHQLLHPFGVEIEAKGEESFAILALPAMLVKEPAVELVLELIESCMLIGDVAESDGRGLGRVLERWLGNRACKGSIKSGRLLSTEEQEALLREMEKTPNIAQCNHGRPTYVSLSLYELDRLFGRKE